MICKDLEQALREKQFLCHLKALCGAMIPTQREPPPPQAKGSKGT